MRFFSFYLSVKKEKSQFARLREFRYFEMRKKRNSSRIVAVECDRGDGQNGILEKNFHEFYFRRRNKINREFQNDDAKC